MDENSARALLSRVASGEPPPCGVDIALARGRGRRTLRRRLVIWPAGSALAVAAVAALLASGLALPSGGRLSAPRTTPSGTPPPTPTVVPDRFGPLQPYASFGWLPPGFTAGSSEALTHELDLSAVDPSRERLISLVGYPAGRCRLTGPQPGPAWPSHTFGGKARKRYPHGLACRNARTLGLVSSAGAIRGRPAFWLSDGGLAWQYAPAAWAYLYPRTAPPAFGLPPHYAQRAQKGRAGWLPWPGLRGSPPTSQSAASIALLRQVAAWVSFGDTTRLVFGFRFTGVPAGWRVNDSAFAATGGQLAGNALHLGPAGNPTALWISTSPASSEAVCGTGAAHGGFVRLDGVRGMLTVSNVGRDQWQSLCFPRPADGLHLVLLLRQHRLSKNALAAGRRLVSLTALVARLRLLGPDIGHWTARPVG